MQVFRLFILFMVVVLSASCVQEKSYDCVCYDKNGNETPVPDAGEDCADLNTPALTCTEDSSQYRSLSATDMKTPTKDE
jgi:hypothetical protein